MHLGSVRCYLGLKRKLKPPTRYGKIPRSDRLSFHSLLFLSAGKCVFSLFICSFIVLTQTNDEIWLLAGVNRLLNLQ